MNDSTDMIKKLKNYLNKKESKYYEDSFDFKGLRENVPQIDGSKKDLFAVSYLVSISNIKYDGDATYYAYFDKSTKNLSYIIGPQSYEKIEE